MPTNQEAFNQYTPSIADASYQFDYVKRITIAAAGTAQVTFPAQALTVRIRQVVMEDVTAAAGGTAPSLIACYYRIDGQAASSAVLADGSASRILKPGENRVISRLSASENGVTIQNPNAASITLQVELAA